MNFRRVLCGIIQSVSADWTDRVFPNRVAPPPPFTPTRVTPLHAPAMQRPGATLLVHFWVVNPENLTAAPGRRAFVEAPYPGMCRIIFSACLLHALVK